MKYKTSEGVEADIWGMMELEPQWVVSRFQFMEKQLESQAWTPVTEGLPESQLVHRGYDWENPVDVWHKKRGRIVDCIYAEDIMLQVYRWVHRGESGIITELKFESVTHWRERPAPPETEEKK